MRFTRQLPLRRWHTDSWQASGATHTTGDAPVHVPAWQVSTCVQASPSLHTAPSGLAGFEHTPVDGLHVPTSWHWSVALQTTGLAPVQTPAWQVSVWVQALPSLHVAPSALSGFEHKPVLGLHVPALWHWSAAVQTTGLVPLQVPDWQV